MEQSDDVDVVAAGVELELIGGRFVFRRVVVGCEVEDRVGRDGAYEGVDRARIEDVDGTLECGTCAVAAGDAMALDADGCAAVPFQAFQQQPAILSCAADDDRAIHVTSRMTLFGRPLLLRCRSPATERSSCRRASRIPARALPDSRENARGGPESSPDWPLWHRPRK